MLNKVQFKGQGKGKGFLTSAFFLLSSFFWLLASVDRAALAESSTQPAQSRMKPNFSEEERRMRFNQKGFGDTFLNDSLNGVSDLLGGNNNGGGFAGNDGLSPLTPEERGIIQQQPSFDPTDVIIPRSGSRR